MVKVLKLLKRKKEEKVKKPSILSRPYRSYINSIYVVMCYGKKITILEEFRPSATAISGYVAGMNKLGYIIITVIDGESRYDKEFESFMLD